MYEGAVVMASNGSVYTDPFACWWLTAPQAPMKSETAASDF